MFLWKQIKSVCRKVARRLLLGVVDDIIVDLGRTVVDNRVHITLFNTRFSETELVSRNVNQIVSGIAPSIFTETITEPPGRGLPSKMCNERDFHSDWMAYWANQMRERLRFDRKLWEFCYVAQVLYSRDMLRPRRVGIGFGCGREPLASLFAKCGADVLATDLPPEHGDAVLWQSVSTHADSREAVLRRDICPDDLLAMIGFRHIDMNAIPSDLEGNFDFCWSCCALEHLGSIERGLAFIERSLDLLKPGGIAVHTTEYTLDPSATIDNYGTVLYQREHFVELGERVRRKNCLLAELDFDPGDHVLDRLPTLATLCPDVVQQSDLVRIKVSLGGFVCTSFGLIITKNAGHQSV